MPARLVLIPSMGADHRLFFGIELRRTHVTESTRAYVGERWTGEIQFNR
jgi:hypothetical protein